MKLKNLLKNIELLRVVGGSEQEISGIQFDSRKITADNLFVATVGTVTDGHEFISIAIQKGAVAIVCEQLPNEKIDNITYIQVKNTNEALGELASAWFNNPSHQLTIIGVTGTNGKTTIATLLYQLFKNLGYKVGLISTVKYLVNDQSYEATHTTPDAITLNQLLRKMADAGCEYAFMEVSSHAITQRRIAGIQFKGAIFTNITRDHIDYHKTFENYLKAKKQFFDHLSNDAFALTNIDDKNGMVMLQNTKARKYTYSTQSIADFKTKVTEESFEGMLLEINQKEVSVSFVGNFNASNLTAVFGAAMILEQNQMEVLRIISKLKSVSGRFEVLRSPTGYTAIVDYAHTPDALENVISAISLILRNKGRLITVVGCGGNRDKGKRPMMAKEAVKGSWKTILTSDNPRDEEPIAIINNMLEGLNKEEKKNSLTIVERREAIKTACAIAQANDVVLIAGKGHEDYQIIKGVKHHFDDKEEVRKCF